MADATGLHIHTLAVRDHRITCDSPVLVQHGMGHDAIALDLDAEWDGLSARLVLGPCGSAYDVLYEGEPVVVPAATLAEAGWLPVSVVGHGGDGTVRVTTERCDHLLRVVESGCVDGSEPIPDAPDLLGQLVEAAERADASADASDRAAAEATGAASAATEAAGKVDAAVESATKAAQSATDAASAATDAAKSANDAAERADKLAEDIPAYVTAAQQAAVEAERAASDADGSATAAGEFASAAAGSAEQASGGATAASESAEAAQGHAADAQQSAAEAESWADAAQVSAGNILTGTATGHVAHSEDAYAAKPREVRIKGRTVKNLWPVINGSSNGVTVGTDETGLITVSGTATSDATITAEAVYAPSSAYVMASAYGTPSTWCIVNGETQVASGTQLAAPSATCGVVVKSGTTVDASFRVMLVEGTEAPDCFVPTGLHSVEPTKLVTAGVQSGDSYEDMTETALPSVELRGLPDGTCDELVVKADGTCEVERKIKVIELDGDEKINLGTTKEKTQVFFVSIRGCIGSDVICDILPTTSGVDAPAVSANVGRVYIAVNKTDASTVEEFCAWLAESRPKVVYVVDEMTEPQSPVTLPQLPAPTFNVWHDSMVPSDTAVEYERDVNIAYEQLEAKIAALTVAQATS